MYKRQLTSTIVSTMLNEGASIAEVVETIAKTLPVCSVRKLAYSTFSVLQIFDDGTAHLVEFDNPPCIFVRNGKVVDLESRSELKEYGGKQISECTFSVRPGDVLAVSYTHLQITFLINACFIENIFFLNPSLGILSNTKISKQDVYKRQF